MVHFFVSYNRADKTWAEWIAWQLEEAEHTTVLQAWDFRPGSNFVLEMQRAAAESDRTVAVLSPDYVASHFAAPEWAAAFAQDPTGERGLLLPVRVRTFERTGLFRAISYVDLVGLDDEAAQAALLAGVERARAKPATAPGFPGAPGQDPAARTVPERPRFPGALPPIWNVPHEHNPDFTGREGLLDQIANALGARGEAAAVEAEMPARAAVHGLGGVGKTQLVVEYAHRHTDQFDVVWWVRAEEPAVLATDYAALAAALGLPTAGGPDQAVAAVRRWLERGERRWLLVFDNAVEHEDLVGYLPRRGGHVLVTTRSRDWPRTMRRVEVGALEPLEAVAFLLKRTGRDDEAAARELAEELGFLPLALAQAGAYADARNLSLAGYLDRYRARRAELLRRGKPDDYPYTVATTWELSFRAAAEQAPATEGLMNLLAFLAPEAVPLDLLAPYAELLPEPLATAMADPVALDDCVAALRRYSLVEAVDETLSAHRLVLSVTRDRLAVDRAKLWSLSSVQVLIAAAPKGSGDPRLWPIWDRLLPHVLAATRHCIELGELNPQVAILQVGAGLHLWSRARSAEARPLLEAALMTTESEHGPDHPDVALVLHHLARVLYSLGDFLGAKQHLERVLEIDEATYGEEDAEVASDLALMGQIFRQLAKLPEARERAERVLAIRRALHKGDQREVAIALNDLGTVLRQQGDAEGARSHHEEALRIHEAADEPELREIATVLDNLGQDLLRLRELVPARARLDRALKIRQEMFGPDHPMTAITIGNIGRVLFAEGKLEQSRERLERALKIDEAASGRDHPDVATDLSNLAEVQLEQGDLIWARDSSMRSLAIRQRTPPNFGEAMSFCLLSVVAKQMGRLEAGLRLFAVQYVVDKLIAHPNAEEKDLPNLRAVAANFGYDDARLEALLAEVAAAYAADRGRGLVAAAFPELEAGEQGRGSATGTQ